jgi:hypothetical protein
MKFSIYFFVVFLLLINGCDTLVDESNSYDYSMEQRMDCFCSRAGIWVKLFIRADTISNAVRISDNKQLTYDEFKYYKSINGLFDLISETDTSTHQLIVTINSEDNYPSFLYIDLKPIVINDSTIVTVADAQISYTTNNYIKLK